MQTFVKNNPISGSLSLRCEANGLAEVAKYLEELPLRVPRVFSVSDSQMQLEKITSTTPTEEQWRQLAIGLSGLHANFQGEFGFSEDNFIGLNPQVNPYSKDWGDFFFNQRLLFQVELIEETQIKEKLLGKLNTLKKNIVQFLNAHNPKPSPVHGDLWSGNVMFSKSDVWLIDPAFYYGDCEVDLAMTKMFGGFSEVFYQEYEKINPKKQGHSKREALYNLYHYLNHYNLFGSGYLSGVDVGFSVIETLD